MENKKNIEIYGVNKAFYPILKRFLKTYQLDDICEVIDGGEHSGSHKIIIKNVPSDYHYVVKKPLRFGKFLQIIKGILCEKQDWRNKLEKVKIGQYAFDPRRKTLEDPETATLIYLTEREQDILLFLYYSQNELVDKTVLLSTVWNYAETVETHTLETHIYRLRQKLEKNPSAPEILITKENGYMLNI